MLPDWCRCLSNTHTHTNVIIPALLLAAVGALFPKQHWNTACVCECSAAPFRKEPHVNKPHMCSSVSPGPLCCKQNVTVCAHRALLHSRTSHAVFFEDFKHLKAPTGSSLWKNKLWNFLLNCTYMCMRLALYQQLSYVSVAKQVEVHHAVVHQPGVTCSPPLGVFMGCPACLLLKPRSHNMCGVLFYLLIFWGLSCFSLCRPAS